MSEPFDRRKFIKAVTYSGLALTITPPFISNSSLFRFKKHPVKK